MSNGGILGPAVTRLFGSPRATGIDEPGQRYKNPGWFRRMYGDTGDQLNAMEQEARSMEMLQQSQRAMADMTRLAATIGAVNTDGSINFDLLNQRMGDQADLANEGTRISNKKNSLMMVPEATNIYDVLQGNFSAGTGGVREVINTETGMPEFRPYFPGVRYSLDPNDLESAVKKVMEGSTEGELEGEGEGEVSPPPSAAATGAESVTPPGVAFRNSLGNLWKAVSDGPSLYNGITEAAAQLWDKGRGIFNKPEPADGAEPTPAQKDRPVRGKSFKDLRNPPAGGSPSASITDFMPEGIRNMTALASGDFTSLLGGNNEISPQYRKDGPVDNMTRKAGYKARSGAGLTEDHLGWDETGGQKLLKAVASAYNPLVGKAVSGMVDKAVHNRRHSMDARTTILKGGKRKKTNLAPSMLTSPMGGYVSKPVRRASTTFNSYR